MAFLGLKILGGIVKGVQKVVGKIKARKESKIQKRIDSALNKQSAFQSTVSGILGPVALPTGNPFQIAASNLLGEKPGVETDPQQEGTVLGGSPQMPAWLTPVLIGVAALFLLPKLLKGRRR
jgi:hypothetical protein